MTSDTSPRVFSQYTMRSSNALKKRDAFMLLSVTLSSSSCVNRSSVDRTL